MDSQINFSSQDQKSEQKIPEPPAAEINIRTMESDLKAFKQDGGEVSGVGTGTSFNKPPVDTDFNNPSLGNVSGYLGPEKGIFPSSGEISGENGSGYGKIIFTVVVILAVIIGLGLAGYYVVFPLLFN